MKKIYKNENYITVKYFLLSRFYSVSPDLIGAITDSQQYLGPTTEIGNQPLKYCNVWHGCK